MDYEKSEIGKCITCGFLAKYSRLIDKYYELPQHQRRGNDSNMFAYVESLTSPSVSTQIACFRRVAALTEETKEAAKSRNAGSALRVLELDRGCASWYPYIEGLTPTRHFERYEMQRLEQRREAFDLKLFELEQRAQENNRLILADSRQLAIDNKQIAEQMKASAETSSKFNRRVNIWLILLTVIMILLGVLQVYLASRPPRPIIIQQQPVEQSPIQDDSTAK